jgi:hypothetical protein
MDQLTNDSCEGHNICGRCNKCECTPSCTPLLQQMAALNVSSGGHYYSNFKCICGKNNCPLPEINEQWSVRQKLFALRSCLAIILSKEPLKLLPEGPHKSCLLEAMKEMHSIVQEDLENDNDMMKFLKEGFSSAYKINDLDTLKKPPK